MDSQWICVRRKSLVIYTIVAKKVGDVKNGALSPKVLAELRKAALLGDIRGGLAAIEQSEPEKVPEKG